MGISRQDLFLQSKGFERTTFAKKKIILVGCGGIGSVLAELLVRGGFSDLILLDGDVVDESNLQRQIFCSQSVGKNKALALLKRLLCINNKLKVEAVPRFLSAENLAEVCTDAALIVDASDNFETRRLIDDYCKRENIPWLYNGAEAGQCCSCLFQGESSAFSRIFSQVGESKGCSQNGVLASTTFAAASLAYQEILKFFLGVSKNELVKLDLWEGKIEKVRF